MIYRLNYIVILESLFSGGRANKIVDKADFDNVDGEGVVWKKESMSGLGLMEMGDWVRVRSLGSGPLD